MSDINDSSSAHGNVPQSSESLGSVPKIAEGFRNILKTSERKESHTLTVREVARHFEAAGVARTERSITNWCHPNKLGVARLDAYFDPNEKKFFITPQSVELAIKEEQAKVKLPANSEAVGGVLRASDKGAESEDSGEELKELKQEIMDLTITNKGKDYLIDQLQKERRNYVDQLMVTNRRVGELEMKLLQLQAPNPGGEAEDILDKATGANRAG